MAASGARRQPAGLPIARGIGTTIGIKRRLRLRREMEDESMMSMDMTGGFGWLGFGLMWLWMLVPLVLVIGVGWLLARAAGDRDDRPRGDEAAAILRERLAAGEIDVEQYDQARAALRLSGANLEGGSPE